jgi:hypothetical protein
MRTTSLQSKLLRRSVAAATAGVLGLTVMTAYAPDARADTVSPTGKGIVGGALLGGEVVMIIESIAGVRAGWAYLVGGGVGAIGGGIGGYFVEKGSTDGRVPVYMLAGGLALVIPAIVLTLNATRYMPDESATEDTAPTGPAAEPGAAGGSPVQGTSPAATPPPAPAPSTPPPASPGPPHVPLSLLDVHEGSLRMGVPVPNVKPMWSTAQMKEYGLQQGTELHMPVFSATF